MVLFILNTKLVKRLKNKYSAKETIENPNIVDIKSAVIEHPKTSHKLSDTTRQKGFQGIGAGKNYESP